MPTEDQPDELVASLRLPDHLGSSRPLVELTEAAHAALRAAQQGWAAHLKAGPGEADSQVIYEDPSMSRVAAQVATTGIVEALQAVEFARPARLAPQLVGKVLAGLRYKPGWTFEPAVLPDGTVAVRVIADLADHYKPEKTFRTSRVAPLRVSGNQTPGEVVVDAALRAVLSIEEHEIKERLRIDGRRTLPIDPHEFPAPTNGAPSGRQTGKASSARSRLRARRACGGDR
jgi:hypothetical protein